MARLLLRLLLSPPAVADAAAADDDDEGASQPQPSHPRASAPAEGGGKGAGVARRTAISTTANSTAGSSVVCVWGDGDVCEAYTRAHVMNGRIRNKKQNAPPISATMLAHQRCRFRCLSPPGPSEGAAASLVDDSIVVVVVGIAFGLVG